MLATFVIGLREGLEASLIVGIIAAFLKQSNRTDALRKVWLGVAAATALCLAVGIGLQLLNGSLPQRQQEMLECVVAAIAVVMISYMVLWMRAHSRDLRKDLQNAAGSALATGSAGALVAMAFLAVIREGFETAVFLLAAFQSALSSLQGAIGVVLGIGVAVGLGYLIYRGGVKLNLSRFFRITGVVLVLVAAGLVMSTLRAAYEAGWLTDGQQTWLDLSAIARPGSVQESLLTGMLGIRSSLPVVEIVAYLLYAIPMLLVVVWPPRRTPSRQNLGRILTATAAVALVVAAALVAFGPVSPAPVSGAQGPFTLQGTASGGTDPVSGRPNSGVTVAGAVEVTLDGTTSAGVAATLAGARVTGTSRLTAAGLIDVPAPGTAAGSVSATRFTGTPVTAAIDPAAAGLPASLSAAQVAAVNTGRLPVGVRAGAAGAAIGVGYLDTVTPAINVDTATGIVLGVELQVVRTVQVTAPSGGPVPVGTVLAASAAAPPGSFAAGLVRVADRADHSVTSQVVTQMLPGLLVVFALVLLAFGLPKLRRRPGSSPDATAPARAPDPAEPDTVTVPHLADAGVVAPPRD
jgi:high-affinity iron transporter